MCRRGGFCRRGGSLKKFAVSLCTLCEPVAEFAYNFLLVGCNGAVLHADGQYMVTHSWPIVLIILYKPCSQCFCKQSLPSVDVNHVQVVETNSGREGLLEAARPALVQAASAGVLVPACCLEGCDLGMNLPCSHLHDFAIKVFWVTL